MKLSLCDLSRIFCNNATFHEKGHAYKILFEFEKSFDLSVDATR